MRIYSIFLLMFCAIGFALADESAFRAGTWQGIDTNFYYPASNPSNFTSGGGGGSASNWSTNAAVSDVNMNGFSVNQCPQVGNGTNSISLNGVLFVLTNAVSIQNDANIEVIHTGAGLAVVRIENSDTSSGSHAMFLVESAGAAGAYPVFKLIVNTNGGATAQEWSILTYSDGANELIFNSDTTDALPLALATNGDVFIGSNLFAPARIYFGEDTDAPWLQGLGTTNIMIGAGTNRALLGPW